MTVDGFNGLCNVIIKKIGEERFASEEFIRTSAANRKKRSAGNKRKIPPIAGEIKVALSIRMLAGGSYLDIAPLFDVSKTSLYTIFDSFLEWMLAAFSFPLVKWIREGQWEALNHLANQFAEKSNGAFFGPFGSLDGLAIRTQSPSLTEVTDPGNYYCRKGFYALNCQAICDKMKRFLWCYPSNKGSTHDSAAFNGSRLCDLLKEETVSRTLHEKGLFLAGDSAHNLSPFLVTPYDVDETSADINGERDSFNFHLSSCRIHIECAFGELVMWWGIFWRTLRFDLHKCSKIIQVCMLLHNYIVDTRQGNDTEDARFFRDFNVRMDHVQRNLSRITGEIPAAVVTDNNEPRRRGRRTLEEAEASHLGDDIRLRLTVKLASRNIRRPLQHDMEYNSHGNMCINS